MHAEQMNAPPTPGRLEIKAAGAAASQTGELRTLTTPPAPPSPSSSLLQGPLRKTTPDPRTINRPLTASLSGCPEAVILNQVFTVHISAFLWLLFLS